MSASPLYYLRNAGRKEVGTRKKGKSSHLVNPDKPWYTLCTEPIERVLSFPACMDSIKLIDPDNLCKVCYKAFQKRSRGK